MDIKERIINNRTKLLIIIGTFLALAIISGVAYAYFGKLIINNTTNAITQINTSFYNFNSTTASVSITLDQNKLDISNASNTYTSFMSNTSGNFNITLDTKNSGSVYCTYDLVYEPTTSYKSSPAATKAGLKEFTISGSSTNGTSFGEIDIAGSSKVTLAKSVLFFADTSYTDSWTFTIKYYNLNVIQDSVIGQTFSGNIKTDNVNCGYTKNLQNANAKDTILAYNGGKNNIESRTLTNAYTEPVSNEGMYAIEDDLGTSYFFRGMVDNNWLQYGEYTSDMYNCGGTLSKTNTGSCEQYASAGDKIYWRIVRINGDGSIRLIYDGIAAPTEDTKIFGGVEYNESTIGNTQYNISSSQSEYVGYKYENGRQHGTSTDSNIKKYLDDWFANYTDLNKTGTKVADQILCNDRSASTTDISYSLSNYTTLGTWNSTGTNYYFGGNGRIGYGISPQLVCPINKDAFTVGLINGKGNSSLIYPVGLITADEASLAGAYFENANSYNNYLSGKYYIWTSTPTDFDNYGSSNIFVQSSSEGIYGDSVDEGYYVRSVISLSSNVKLSGTGTWDNVYTVEE